MPNSTLINTLGNLQNEITEILNVVQEENNKRNLIWVDLTKREVNLPSSIYADFLNVENDHLSTEVWFQMDRYFDGVDLSKMSCVIEYINAANEGRVCPVFTIDTETYKKEGFLCICWQISREVTKKAGKIKFAIHFYEVEKKDDRYVYTYSLTTCPCEATILKSVGDLSSADTAYDYPAEGLEAIYGRLNAVEQKAVLWRDLD